MPIHQEPGWFIPVKDGTTPEQIETIKKLYTDGYGDDAVVKERLYGRKGSSVYTLQTGEDFEREGRVMTVVRVDQSLLHVFTDRRPDAPMMVGQHELLNEIQYTILKSDEGSRRRR